MKLVKYLRYTILSLLIGSGTMGCSDWLQVTPQSEIDQEDLFSDTGGFEDALIEVYLIASDVNLYGKKLSFYDIEFLAQQYKPSEISDKLYQEAMMNYDFEDVRVDPSMESLFRSMYNAIANCNNLIQHIEKTSLAFADNRKELILGEALALRAWMHFDLLRLFHPTYSNNPEFVGIPYSTKLTYEPLDYLSSTELVELVMDDLDRALPLLEEIDPILGHVEPSDLFEEYRVSRMNYYAIKGLMARVNIYTGNYSDALLLASDVITSENFSFAEPNDVLGESDYLFQSELIFRLYASKLKENSEILFSPTALNPLFCRELSRYQGDVIRKNWFNNINSSDPIFWKYNYTYNDNNSYVPILKLGELILIEAECKARTSSPIEGVQVLNEMRTSRGLSALDTETTTWTLDDLMVYIQKEYEREFFGEGQLFYFYKRIYATQIATYNGEFVDMNDDKYTLPLPMSEIQFGGASNE